MVGHGWGVFLWWFDAPNDNNIIEGNVIGNTASGIHVSWGSGNVIRGNHLGIDREGNPIPNDRGVSTGGSSGEIGGCTIGPRNVIAHNNEQGIAIYEAADATTITENSIFGNGGGIFRNPASALLPPTVLETSPISGTAPPGSTVELFLDGGHEGRFFIGTVKADIAGNFSTAFDLTGFVGNVTATATDANGNTSEFSLPVPMAPQLVNS